MIKQDAKLYDHGTYYDIEIVNGDIETEDALDTAIITSLFTDARADESEVPTPQYRRGWIGNLGYEFELGSKLWLFLQSRVRQKDLIKISSEVDRSLERLVQTGIATEVESLVSIIDSKVMLEIKMERPNGSVDHRYFELWDNTGQ